MTNTAWNKTYHQKNCMKHGELRKNRAQYRINDTPKTACLPEVGRQNYTRQPETFCGTFSYFAAFMCCAFFSPSDLVFPCHTPVLAPKTPSVGHPRRFWDRREPFFVSIHTFCGIVDHRPCILSSVSDFDSPHA